MCAGRLSVGDCAFLDACLSVRPEGRTGVSRRVRSVFANDAALTEGGQEFGRSIEVRQLYVGSTDALRIVGVGTDSRRQTEFLREFGRLEIVALIGDLRVEYLDDVQIAGFRKRFQPGPAHASTLRIEGMRCIHQPTLGPDSSDYFRHRQDVWNPLGKKQADQLARRGPYLFADNDAGLEITRERRFRRLYRVVIRDTHDVESHRFHAFDDLVDRGARVARGERVQVTIKSNEAVASRRRWPNRIQQQQEGD